MAEFTIGIDRARSGSDTMWIWEADAVESHGSRHCEGNAWSAAECFQQIVAELDLPVSVTEEEAPS